MPGCGALVEDAIGAYDAGELGGVPRLAQQRRPNEVQST